VVLEPNRINWLRYFGEKMEKIKKIDASSIMLACQSGTESTLMWSKLREILLALTYNLPNSYCFNCEDRQDMSQDVIEKILSGSIRPFEARNRNAINVKKYLIGCLRNASRNYRKEYIHEEIPESIEDVKGKISAENFELYKDLDTVISSFDQEKHKILKLRYLEGLSYNEIVKKDNLQSGIKRDERNHKRVLRVCKDFELTLAKRLEI